MSTERSEGLTEPWHFWGSASLFPNGLRALLRALAIGAA
jgi:hypothetical protein